MIRVRTERSTVFVNIHFTPPLFDWNPVPARFFQLINASLPRNFTDDPSFFSATTGNSLAEVSAGYNVFGDRDTITLSAKTLSMEFREFSANLSDSIFQIVHDVETGFITHFPECIYDVFEILTYEDLELPDGSAASEYLDRYAMPSIHEAFGNGDTVQAPSGHFSVNDEDGTWSTKFFVEKSRILDNGLFVHVQTSLLQVDASDALQERYDRVAKLGNACLRALDLERIDD